MDPEVVAALTRGRKLVDSNADQLGYLRALGSGLNELPLVELSGPLVEFENELTTPPSREAPSRWAAYFAQHLDDVSFYRTQIDNQVILDPTVVFEVVGMTEELLRASAHALRRSQAA